MRNVSVAMAWLGISSQIPSQINTVIPLSVYRRFGKKMALQPRGVRGVSRSPVNSMQSTIQYTGFSFKTKKKEEILMHSLFVTVCSTCAL